jgi:hypothetical protein
MSTCRVIAITKFYVVVDVGVIAITKFYVVVDVAFKVNAEITQR